MVASEQGILASSAMATSVPSRRCRIALSLVLSLLLFPSVQAAGPASTSLVEELTDGTFDQQTLGGGAWLIIIYSPWYAYTCIVAMISVDSKKMGQCLAVDNVTRNRLWPNAHRVHAMFDSAAGDLEDLPFGTLPWTAARP